MTLIFRVADAKDMFTVMDIRNSGREYMTHNTREITHEEQYDWWMSPDHDYYKVFIVEIDKVGEPRQLIGFCMIHTTLEGYEWGTLCLYPEYRGRGYGTEIYKFMVDQAEVLWIEVQRNNLSSLYAALNAGFIVYSEGNNVVTLVARKGN